MLTSIREKAMSTFLAAIRLIILLHCCCNRENTHHNRTYFQQPMWKNGGIIGEKEREMQSRNINLSDTTEAKNF